MLLDSDTNLPPPINTLLAICPSVPSLDHVHPLIAVFTIWYHTLYPGGFELELLKSREGGSVPYSFFTLTSV